MRLSPSKSFPRVTLGAWADGDTRNFCLRLLESVTARASFTEPWNGRTRHPSGGVTAHSAERQQVPQPGMSPTGVQLHVPHYGRQEPRETSGAAQDQVSLRTRTRGLCDQHPLHGENKARPTQGLRLCLARLELEQQAPSRQRWAQLP